MDFAARKQVLEARRLALAGHLLEVEHALDAPMPKDWEDRSSERQGDEVLETLGLSQRYRQWLLEPPQRLRIIGILLRSS